VDPLSTSAPGVRLLGISGSLRAASMNTGLLRLAGRVLPPGASLTIHDLHDVPFYDGDVEAAGDPPGVQRLRAAIRDAHGVLLACPEYNTSVTPVPKNAIDWASRPPRERPLAGKPVAVVGAGGGVGTRHAQEHLRQILQVVGMELVEGHEVAVVRARQLVDEQGDFEDEGVAAAVAGAVAALADLARSAPPTPPG
jgi:chromate reductase, NAD(P)H dehydrogenase (quinone)